MRKATSNAAARTWGILALSLIFAGTARSVTQTPASGLSQEDSPTPQVSDAPQPPASPEAKSTVPSIPAGESSSVEFAKPPLNLQVPDVSNTWGHQFRQDISRVGKDFLFDQKQIWTSPAQMQLADTEWLFPILGVTAGLIQTDGSYSAHISGNAATWSRYNKYSNYGLAAIAGAAGSLYIWSYHNHNDKMRETGILSAEAALNSFLFVEASKYVASRDTPMEGNGRGLFFQPGGTSFPSMHSALAWSVAGVVAHEYPGPLTKILAYGLATFVSYSRVHAKEHFNSDVFIGGIAGQMLAQQTYSNHHDTELGGEVWNSFRQTIHGPSASESGQQGSPYIPLDSWVYPIFDRLNALGYLTTAATGMRPWTRLECARLLNQAINNVQVQTPATRDTESMLSALNKEFAVDLDLLNGGENRSAHLESTYTRFTEITGPPLNDSYHFGQTITQDFGRPYEEGFNDVTGYSAWATAGRWVFYSRGEYQYAPSAPAYSADVRNFIATADQNPVQPATPVSQTSKFQPLDMYAGLDVDNWQLTFGQQSLVWGPTQTGSFMISDNAVPVNMIQLNRTTPLILPWIFSLLGPVRTDFFFGSFAGNQFPANPFFHGEKITIMMFPHFEIGFSRTVVLGGTGEPLTLRRVFDSYFSTTARGPGQSLVTDPGKRTGGMDASYAVPWRRFPFTFYVDSIADDNTSPFADMRRAGMNPGLYFPKLPWLSKMDLRLEASYSDVPYPEPPGFFIYFDHRYHDLYTNDGQLIGNPVGRDGKSYQAWSRYWLGPKTNLQFSYRHMQVSPSFLPGGGTINDASVHTDFWIHRNWDVSATVQYEKWAYPLLAPGPQTNVTTSLGITFMPVGGRP